MKKATVNNGANSANNMVNENKNFKEVKTMKANNNHNNHIDSANNANSNNSVNENKIKKEVITMTKKNSNSNKNTFNTIVEQPKTYLATTKTGHKIYLCDETLEHMKAHSDVSIEHIKEAIEANETYQGPFEIRTLSLGYIIGKDRCIEVGEWIKDPEVHALYRKGHEGPTPVTFSKEARDTSLMTIGICLDQDLKDTLFTAFYGQLAPKEPWDLSLSEYEQMKSYEFWKTHALVTLPEDIDWERSDKKFMPNKKEEQEMENKNNGNDKGVEIWGDSGLVGWLKINKDGFEVIEKSEVEDINNTVKENKNEQEDKTMNNVNFNKTNTMTQHTIFEMIEEKRYAKPWLSFNDSTLFDVAIDAIEQFNNELDAAVRLLNNAIEAYEASHIEGSCEECDEEEIYAEYYAEGCFECIILKDAVETVYNETAHGDIAPFMDYCSACWHIGEHANISDYEKIRKSYAMKWCNYKR